MHVAQHCGMANESALVRRFIKTFGITPKEHRARLQSAL
ncbi:AraC family transcriptional regulator [Pseudomonas asturiensis]